MPIVEAVISADILSLVNNLNTGDPTGKTAEETNQAFSDGLATIIKDALLSMTVEMPLGTFSTGASPAVIISVANVPCLTS